MSRCIDADELMELLTTAIRNMKGIAKFIGAGDDPEIQMEIKAYTDIANGVKDMPTIEPERKTGKWILKEHLYECDKCGCRISRFPFKGNIWNYYFCPNCGAKMEGETDETA